MTNTQQTILAEEYSSEKSPDDVELTELLPVKHSRIQDRQNNKDQDNTTDGLKVIRSFTDELQDYKFNEDNTNLKKQQYDNKNKIYKRPYDDDNDDDIDNNNKSTIKKRLRNLKNKNFLKDEIYYYRQDENSNDDDEDDDDDELQNNNNKKNKKTKKSIVKNNNNKKIQQDKIMSVKNTDDTSENIENVEKDLRLNIDVIIQASYLLEQENENSNTNENEKQLDNRTETTTTAVATTEATTEAATSSSTTTNDEAAIKEDENKNSDNKKYKCLLCDSRFKGSGGLRNHYKVVHATGPLYKCDNCGKEFPLKERLKLHVRTHTGFKPYKCTDCDKCFARGGQLVQHKRTHSHIKPYQCDLCMGQFTCSANLTLHMKRHNGQKDHTCSICGKGFIRRDALKKHLECLHKDLKSFLCIICNKTFKGHLPQHMRTHARDRPYDCPTCGQKFAQKSQLTVHQRTHNGQRPFRCLVCWQAFAHSTALKLHTRRHTGERPFKCTECNVGFTQLPHWKKHMKCIHKRNKPYSCKSCNNYFKKKNDLEYHEKLCVDNNNTNNTDNNIDNDNTFETNNKYKTMNLEKMRLLLAVLLKRISKPERLDELGFGKRLIDEILQDSLISAGKQPAKRGELNEFERLRKNIETFLEWTVPKEHWDTFKKLKKTPEEILETLTTT